MASSRTLKLKILGDVDGLNKSLKTTETSVSDFGKKAAAAFAVAAAAVAAFAVKLGVDAVKAAIEDEKAQQSLARTLKNVVEATDSQVASLENFITQTALATGVADDELRPALDRLVRATGSLEASQGLLNVALDVSAGTGKSLDSVVQALGRGYEGNTTALGRLGTGLTKSELATSSFQEIVAKLSNTFKDQASTQAETFAGRMAKVQVALDEAKEEIGYALLPILEELVKWIEEDILPNLDDWVASFKDDLVPTLKKVMHWLGEVADDIDALSKGIESATAFTRGWDAWLGELEKGWNDSILRGWLKQVGLAADETQRAAISTAALSAAARALNSDLALANRKDFNPYEKSSTNWLDSLQAALSSATDAAVGAVSKSVDKVADATQKKLADYREKLAANLERAKQDFKEYAESVAGTISSILNFGDAQQAFEAAAANAEESGQSFGGNFITALQEQAAKAAEFAAKIKELIQLGLSEAGISQVLQAGADAGIKIADTLIAGGADTIAQTNDLISTTEAAAKDIGVYAADSFYQAGVDTAQEILKGFDKLVKKGGKTYNQIMNLMDKLAAAAKREVELSVNVKTASTANVASVPASVPALASGGIVTMPTLALVGEAGAEAVIPLSKLDSMGTTYNITVNGAIDAEGVARTIQNVLRQSAARTGNYTNLGIAPLGLGAV